MDIKKYLKYFFYHKNIFDVFLLLIMSIIPFISYYDVIIPETDIGYDINPFYSFLRKMFLWDGGFNFGSPISYTVNIYNFFNVLLSGLNLSSFVIKQLWLSLLLFVTGLSMYYFVGVFLEKEKRLCKIITSVTYMYSLYLIRTLMGASTMVIGYVLFPLILGLYINGLNDKKRYLFYAILIGLISIFFSNINFTYIAIDLVAIFIFIFIYLINYKRINLLYFFKYNMLILCFGLLISSWWLIPLVKTSIISPEYITESLQVETHQTYNVRSSYLETFRLLGDLGFSSQYKGVPDVSFSKYYLEDPIWIFSTFLFAVLSICGLFFVRSKIKKTYLILLLVFFSAMAVGAYSTTNLVATSKIYVWCYDHIPLFSIFRNGYKSVAIISFVYSILFGCFASSIYFYFRKKFKVTGRFFYNIISFIFIFLVFGLILLNSFPLWTGKMFDNKKFKAVPTYWYEIGDYLNKDSLDYRVFTLPDSYFPIYYWGNPKSDVSSALIDKPIIGSLGRAWGYKQFTKLIYTSFLNQNTFSRMISLSNIKYIIQRNDIDWMYYNTNSPEKIKKILEVRKDLIFEKTFGELDLYRVNENYFLPRLYSPEVFSYVGNDVDFIDQTVLFNENNFKIGILFSDFKFNNLTINKNILEKINSVFISVEANSAKVAEMKLVVDKEIELKEKKKLQKELDLYISNLFFKDFQLSIPQKATYKIYFKTNSILANNKNIEVKIGEQMLKKGKMGTDREGWNYFNQIELDKGEFALKLYLENEPIDYINSGDIVFSAENLVKPIQAPQLEYKQVNPTKYIVNVHGASESFPLVFSESFHPGWKIYIEKIKPEVESGKFVSENNQGTIQNENLDSGHFYDVFSREPVLDGKHFMINGFANAWWIDLSEACKVESGEKNLCNKNADERYDFSIVIEFEPQRFFYIGLAISGTTLLFCFGYLVYDWRKRKIVRNL
ncbi:MAG TPA: hypothetical protein DEB09_00605 [Candidatus Magasanikbacteria bacterium]|nr:hypothetical protein [Candidatus Magasanikbacteria bacterium]